MERRHPHLGVLAFGDSITNAGGELQRGVALQSWALWTARGLGLPYTGYAVDGARASGVVHDQIPAFLARAADPEGPYDLGCLYIGINDVCSRDWDGASVAADIASALQFLGQRCERVLTVVAPHRLGRVPSPPAPELEAIVRAAAAEADALLLDLSDFGARNHVMTDWIHPTAFGQVAIAQRALTVLAADGMRIVVDPATYVHPNRARRIRALRSDVRFAYRDLQQRLHALWSQRHKSG
jgi:lysophospholipase L1-like esterase